MTRLVKKAFNAGEVSPTLWQRDDVDKVHMGCRYLLNFFVHTHGAVFRRAGIVKWGVLS